MGKNQRPVVSIAAFSGRRGSRRLLVQRRRKEREDTPYTGYLELPQGKIAAHETVVEAARRELAEETGLEVVSLIRTQEESFSAELTSDLWTINPLCCTIDRIQNHISLGLAALVRGEPTDTGEAVDHRWVTSEELGIMLECEKFFPLNLPLCLTVLDLASEIGWQAH